MILRGSGRETCRFFFLVDFFVSFIKSVCIVCRMNSNILFFIVVAIVVVFVITPSFASENGKHLEGKPYHHLENGFRNVEGAPERGSTFSDRLSFFRKTIWGALAGAAPPIDDTHAVPLAQAKEQFRTLYTRNNDDMISWVGHATFFIRIGGVNVLTDPVFADRASPFQFAGPKRFLPAAPALEDLPQIDVIILSHAHYDHLDTQTLDRIEGRENITAIVPLGLGHYFTKRNFGAVYEVDWYDTITLPALGKNGFKATAYPAVHWSSRTPFDENRTLWMSFAFAALDGDGHATQSVFHSGDTEAYSKLFTKIGTHMAEHYNGCTIGLLGAGAYLPRVIMEGVHSTPEGAVEIGEDVGCQRMVPMHWGTFRLSFEEFYEPRDRFAKAAGNKALIMRIGESLKF